MMIFTIAWRELRNLFISPLAWCVLAVVQFIMAWMFLIRVDEFLKVAPRLASLPNPPGVTDAIAADLFSTAGVILLMVVPLLTMRLLSEERRAGTIRLLRSAPVSITEVVLGKFLGLFLFLLLMVVLIVAMPLSLSVGTHLDYGKLFAGALGLILLLAAFASAGLFMSSLTRQPVVAAISSFGLLLLLWIINWASGVNNQIGPVFHYASLIQHYGSLLKGNFNSADVMYYLLFVATFLILSIRKLDNERLQH